MWETSDGLENIAGRRCDIFLTDVYGSEQTCDEKIDPESVHFVLSLLLLSTEETLVVPFIIRHYLAELAKAKSGCASLAVDFENLNHSVQMQLHLREYLPPVLVGYSSGAGTLEPYLAAWRKDQVDLVGYSFGAEVLPFIVARLPEELRTRIGSITLIGPSPTALFEIHVADWLPWESESGLAF
jgi:type IV secretory pathway VirJ component